MRVLMVAMLFVATPAWADQCAWVTPAQAEAAVALLNPGTKWLALCEPCGDVDPAPSTVSTVQAKRVSVESYREVSINGEPVDLAYTFVQGPKQGTYDNLAKKVGCGAFEVSDRITWPTRSSAKKEAFVGSYQKPGAKLKLDHHALVNQRSIQVWTDANADQQPVVKLSSQLHLSEQPLAFGTGLGACTVGVEQAGSALELTPASSCGGLLDALAGRYERVR